MKRRAFLQRSGLMLAVLGVSEAGLSLFASRYQQALAQPTHRKLALLVGINQYSEQVCDCTPIRGLALSGCLTDVELQRELLIHRFGFQPSDIVTLTDQQATRQGIEEAFLSHLTAQARPGDVVVFHFSGLGSQIQLGTSDSIQNGLVPVDGGVPTEDNPVINDLLEDTLGLLLRSLQTEQVTTILDTSYTNRGRTLQGNLRIRSRPNVPIGQPHLAELAIQEQLLSQLGVSREQIRAQWRSGQLPGIVLTAASANQVATEGQWNGFSAGLFTYALTQQLWWTTPATTLRTSLSQAIGTVKQASGVEQQPGLSGQKIQTPLPAYYLTLQTTNADGVIRLVEEDGKAALWLAGLPMAVLENYGASVLTVVDAHPEPIAPLPPPDADPTNPSSLPTPDPLLLQIRSRDGLTFKTRPLSGDLSLLQPGRLVQEAVRILPRNIGLTVALDASLERIERVDATSAFASIPKVSSVIAGEQPADFLFGKTQSTPTLTASLSPELLAETTPPSSTQKGYGLFYLGRNAIPNTLIQEDEAVKTAVHRIAPQLRTLLATKLLRLTANRGSSRLGVRATLEIVSPQERVVMQQETVRAPWQPPENKLSTLLTGNGAVTLPVGSRIQYRLWNYGESPIYFILLGLDTHGNAIAFCTSPEKSIIPPGENITVPQSNLDWMIQPPSGLAETHIIFSLAPLIQSYQALKVAIKADTHPITIVFDPLEVAQTLLQDLHQASAPILPKIDIPADTYVLDVNVWATLSFVYQVSNLA
ncbi:MAG: caspase family protein [Cyanobacteria bacterium CRU_2_1]|nr:caspase family protein [Cyanobacteria bacterium RU_5_0]NJR59152.1 caspase family protein [Cyanobacteria bacterium CRU_2_1]